MDEVDEVDDMDEVDEVDDERLWLTGCVIYGARW